MLHANWKKIWNQKEKNANSNHSWLEWLHKWGKKWSHIWQIENQSIKWLNSLSSWIRKWFMEIASWLKLRSTSSSGDSEI